MKKSYAKIKQRVMMETENDQSGLEAESGLGKASAASLDLHPERQVMLDDVQDREIESAMRPAASESHRRGPRRGPDPFNKESQKATQRKAEQEARSVAKQEALRQQHSKRDEREKFRKAMVKAKSGGKDRNQRRLGRESKPLLAKIQNMMKT